MIARKGFHVDLAPEAEAYVENFAGFSELTLWEKSVMRLAYKLNRSGQGLIDYGAAITFANQLIDAIDEKEATR